VRRLLPVVTALAVHAWTVALAQERPKSSDPLVSYEIAAQDLDAAINAYVRASAVQVLFETAITAGKHSAPLKGRFSAAQALQILLAGTGLTASRTDVDAFVIVPAGDAATKSALSTAVPDKSFLAALQTGVLDALCRDPQTRPGSYKVAIELWIGPSGVIQRSSLIGSTGNAERDQALSMNLRGASLAATPPATLPQPFVITITPRAPRETGDCAG
jgi:hypothetical protein